MNEVSRKINRIVDHIKFGNTQLATAEVLELEKLLIKHDTEPTIVVNDEHFRHVADLTRHRFGDDKPFYFGMALLLHSSKRFNEALDLFTKACGEHPNGTQKND